MIYIDLFMGFLKVGCFAFGGAYGAIPLIQEVVMSYGWISDEMFAYFVAVSESTPGPIMVNLATYIGSRQAGFMGAVLATLGVVLPSFIIILVLTALLKTFLKNPYVQAVIHGIKPCIIGIVLATGVYMIYKNCFLKAGVFSADFTAIAITVMLFVISYAYKTIKKKALSPVMLIVISAVMGVAVYGI